MINIGILGAAKIAPPAIILPAGSRNDCQIIAVACRDKARGTSFAEEHNIPNLELSYEALVERHDIDLIYNALPPNRHADLSIAALHAGKAVLCEKPFAMNAVEAEAMINAAKETGQLLLEAFHYRFHPGFIRALNIVQSGQIGTIKHIAATFNAGIPFSDKSLRHRFDLGGGALMDLGCYPLHWSRVITGEEPSILQAMATTKQSQVDLSMQASLAFPSGISADISCSMAPDEEFFAELVVEGDAGVMHMHNPLHPQLGHSIKVTLGGETTTETVDGEATFHYQLAHMINVLNGHEAPITGGADALANMAAIDTIYRAAGLRPRGLDC